MAGLDGDLEDSVVLLGGVNHGVGLFDGHGDRLLADDMQAGVEAVDGRDGVAGGRRRVDDGVEIGLDDHFAIVFVSLRDMESFGEFFKLLRVEVAEGDEFEFVRIVDDAVAVDVAENGGACSDGSDADFFHGFSFGWVNTINEKKLADVWCFTIRPLRGRDFLRRWPPRLRCARPGVTRIWPFQGRSGFSVISGIFSLHSV